MFWEDSGHKGKYLIPHPCTTLSMHWGPDCVWGAAQNNREVRPFSGVPSTEQAGADQTGMEEEERPSYAKNDLGSRAQ